ncbi:MAG TPA: long-chain fatty acid--CoA ligase [Thermoleophilaceae bacterium]|jgi:long-chain acyl-CoA synthetase
MGEPPSAAGPAGPGTLCEVLVAAAGREGTAIRRHDGEAWRDVSNAELGRTVRDLARGLIALGVEHGDRVAIFANTRPEWVYADLASLCAGAVVVPVYQTSSPEECEHVLSHSGARVVVCEDAELVERVEGVRASCPALEHVVVLDGPAAAAIDLAELRERGAAVAESAVDERIAAVRPDDLCTIVYTSGTSGPPKGCMLTHANYRASCEQFGQVVDFGPDPVLFLFLPLAHAMTRVTTMFGLDRGVVLAFWRGDMTRVRDDLAEVRPTHLPSAPRLFEKIYAAATAVRDGGGAKARMLDWAIAAGVAARDAERAGRRPGPLVAARRRVADRLVLRKVRELFGGRLRLALSGAAPIAAEILELFDACGIVIIEGYGLTETASGTTCNRPDGVRYGTVGPPLPGAEVRIADDGEVLTRGPHVFAGYYRDEEATAEALRDGWLHTGDLGELSADGYLTITGRKKDILITSSGKNVAPGPIENLLRESRWVGQAVVIGERRPYLVALIALDPDELGALAELAGAEPDLAALAAHPRVREEVGRAVERVNARLARAEQVKRFAVLDADLTQESGELTPTMKVRRSVVQERRAAAIEELYDRPRDAGGGADRSAADDEAPAAQPLGRP